MVIVANIASRCLSSEKPDDDDGDDDDDFQYINDGIAGPGSALI
jgi:hypothetical protein